MEDLFRGMVVSELPGCLQTLDCCNCGRKKTEQHKLFSTYISQTRHNFTEPLV